MVNDITRCLFLSLFLCFYLNIGLGQFDQSISANHPPTPNAASLAKYGEIPISHYNGTANISIPLETISDGNIQIPLSLNYHSSGLKVAETASWVGLGWSLQSGGVISRTIRGLPDERGADNQVVGFLDGPLDETNYVTYLNQLELVDSESDIYYFNFGGYSGSFTFYYDTNDDLQVLLTDYSEIGIEPIVTSTSYNKLIWRITLPNGIRYYLGDKSDNGDHKDDAVSYSKYYKQGTGIGPDKPTVDSWYVVRIEDLLSGGFLEFDYEWEAYQFRTHGSSRYFIDDQGRNIFTTGSLSRYNQTLDHIVSMSLSPRLKTISSRQYTYEFIPGTTRKDLDPTKQNTIHPMYVTNIHTLGTIGSPKVLDRIEKRKLNGTCLKKYTLSTDYFTSSTAGYIGSEAILYNVTYDSDPYKPDRLRLRLTDVTEESCNNTDKKKHSIQYTSDDVIRRLSLSSDHWGFHNGQTGNKDPAPALLIQTSTNSEPLIDLSHIPWLSNKSSNQIAMLQGMIKKIIYPTGGSTEFDFTANFHRTTTFENTIEFLADDDNCSGPSANPCNDAIVETTGVNITTAGNESFEIVIDGIRSFHETGNTPYVLDFYYNIGSNGWVKRDELILDASNGFSINRCYRGSDFGGNNVKFRVVNTSSPNIDTYIFLQVQKMEWEEVNRNEMVGGLRLKTLTHDPIVGPKIVENLNYTTTLTENVSSGKLYGVPIYLLDMVNFPMASIIYGDNNCENTPYQLFSGSQVAPASTQGSHIGYKTVFHELGDGSEGYTEYSYLEDENFEPSVIVEFPAPPEQYFDRLAGKPNSEKKYRKNISDYTLVSSIDFEYKKTEIAQGTGHRFFNYVECKVEGDSEIEITVFAFGEYNAQSWVYQNQSTNSELDGVSNTYAFTYNSTYPTLINSESHINSDNKTFETKYFYPDTYPSNLNNLATNLDKKKLLSPWKIEKHYDDPLFMSKSGLVGGAATMWSYYDVVGGGATTSETEYLFPNILYEIENTWDDPDVTLNEILGDLETHDLNKQVTFLEYDFNAGKPSKVQREHWANTDDYTFDAQGKQLTWAYDQYSKSWTWQSGTDLMNTETNIDGTSHTYTWDGLMRLKTVTDDQRLTKTTYTYSYDQMTIANNFHKESNFFPSLGQTARTLKDVHFMDGLSRKYQTKKIAQGPTIDESIVISTEYDAYKRVGKEYEPIAFSNITETPETISGDNTSFEYEASPLNRITKSISPETWMFTEISFGTNLGSDVSGFAAGSLHKKTIIDANDNVVESFSDKRGREVLRRAFDDDINVTEHDTRTYYDGLDRQVLIVPPGATSGTQDLLHRWTYHATGTIASEIVPGKGLMEYRYNLRELLAYSRDPMQAATRWRATTYDGYGNLDKQGWRNTTANLADDNVADATINTEKINYDFGTAGSKKGKLSKSEVQEINSTLKYTHNYSYDAAGRISDIEFNHPISTSLNSLIHEFSYDSADNLIQKYNDYTAISSHPIEYSMFQRIDHAGRLEEEWYGQGKNLQNRLSSYAYTEKNQIGQLKIGKDLQTVDYEYLKNKLLSKINGGSLTGEDLYQQELFYNNPKTSTHGEGRMNGDISSWEWQISGESSFYYNYKYDGFDRLKKAYGNGSQSGKYSTAYTYDKRGNTMYLERRNGNSQFIDMLNYDYVDGNQLEKITDNATFKAEGYDGSAVRNYDYDSNGNVDDDESRDITSSYNHLNLVDSHNQNSGNYIQYLYDEEGNLLTKSERNGFGQITKTEYLGDIEYETIGNGTPQIKRIHHSHGFFGLGPVSGSATNLHNIQNTDIDECHAIIDSDENIQNNAEVNYFGVFWIDLNPGFCVEQGSEFLADFKPYGKEEFFWKIRDHLGNERVIFDSDRNVVEKKSFYPNGAPFEKLATNGYNWKRDGTEVETTANINYNRYKNRFHDPYSNTWLGVDRFSAKYSSLSPYSYAGCNPVKYADINGDSLWISHRGNNYLYENGKLFLKGEEYTGKVRGFLKKTVKSLNKISSTTAGGKMLQELQSNEHNVFIKYRRGAANFVPGFGRFGSPELKNNAEGIRVQEKGKVIEAFDFTEIGSGGTIYIDPSLNHDRRSMILAHELFHANDAIYGLLDSRFVKFNGGVSQIQEIRAVYNTNLIRRELGYSLRKNYSGGPSLLDQNNSPINISPPYKFN